MDADPWDPRPDERTVGDLVSPVRPGARAVDAVNAASRAVGRDVADWPVDRLLAMLATLDAEARARQRQEGPAR